MVSCIMPTRNRRRFVGQSIWYFLRQDYAPRELIILDDGEDAVADLVPNDERIRYVRLDRRLSLGAKRNLGCELSRGSLIAHWDDDDWMAAERLSIQVTHLLESDALACGARHLLYYRPDAGEAWIYHAADQARPWLAGNTLVYCRVAWQEHPFPDLNVGEDNAFVWQLPSDRLRAVPDSSFYIALIHRDNTSAKNLADPRWERRPLDEVTRLLALDRDFYVALRNHRALQAPQRSSVVQAINVGGQFEVSSGYGSMAEYLVLGLERAGASVNVVPLTLDLGAMSAAFQDIVRRSRPDIVGPALYFSWPRADLERFRTASDLFINTMWESSRLPLGWTEQLNRARAVIVPTRFVARVCVDSGVTVPLEVIPEGIDPAVYHYEERPERPGLTTLVVGPLDNRKHVPEAIAAWKKAFAGDGEARLIIKTQYNYRNYVPDDPRITYIDQVERTRGIVHWYRQADVLLALGNEGFGLPLVEGMATGLPVIALNSEGQADVCQEACEYLLPIEPSDWQAYDNPVFGRCGLRGIPGVDDVAARLRWVASHRDEARAKGRAASAWAMRHRNVWAKGPAVLEVMERHVRPARSLRRCHLLWVPSWKSPCGVAEYTAHLSEWLPTAKVSAPWPDLRGARLLHIEQEHTLFHDVTLTRCVQQARASRVPVIITEHRVTHEVRAWEREADVLMTLTQAGAELLKARWPGKAVQVIPSGCPTWFPPRKRTRACVIGTFGFLERHKGFWQLLALLRRLPEAELLMFSYAKSEAIEAQWTEAAVGLPVRRERRYLPIDEVAQQLAAECDILVFWYDQIADLSSSYAARIGLATGVPVLTSPTSWFSDLREVTYQPENLLEGVKRLMDDTRLRERLVAAAHEYCHEHSWPRIAERHLALWRALETT
jgi:glycosyltransferase involved in cell wall biosynthesis